MKVMACREEGAMEEWGASYTILRTVLKASDVQSEHSVRVEGRPEPGSKIFSTGLKSVASIWKTPSNASIEALASKSLGKAVAVDVQ